MHFTNLRLKLSKIFIKHINEIQDFAMHSIDFGLFIIKLLLVVDLPVEGGIGVSCLFDNLVALALYILGSFFYPFFPFATARYLYYVGKMTFFLSN